MYPSNANNCIDSEVWLEKEEEYGCHKAHSGNNMREKVCLFCAQLKPASLEELAFSVILENAELVKRMGHTLRHIPPRMCWLVGRAINANLLSQAWQLVSFVSEYDEIRPSWFDVDHGQTMYLSRFRLTCEVCQKLKPFMTSGSAGTDEILRYLSNFRNSYQDFWSQMASAFTKLKAETDGEGLDPLKSKIPADENKVVRMKAKELTGDIRLYGKEYKSMKKLQRLTTTFACPVIFKPATIGLCNVKMARMIPKLLDHIDPKIIVDVDLEKYAWTGEAVDTLGSVLSACTNLSSIYLRQTAISDEVRERIAQAISSLLSHHHQLQKIGLDCFNLSGTLAKYPLPSVENLRLRACTFTEEDFVFMANKSDLSLKTLVVNCNSYYVHCPSLCIFIQSQAKLLTTLGLGYPNVSPTEICELLRNMVKFNRLQVFELICILEIDFFSIENIIVDLMSIRSTRSFFIKFLMNSDGSDFEAGKNHLYDVVKELCKIHLRPPIKLELELIKI